MRKAVLSEAIKYATGFIILSALIEIVASVSILPGISATAKGFLTLWNEGSLQHNLQVSTARWLIGWSIGGLVGVVFGLLTGRVWHVRLGLEGLFVIFRAIPFICLVPMSILLFGLEESGKFFLVAWASATVSWVVVHESAYSLQSHHKWRAMSLGATRMRWVARVLLPACGEGIHAGLRASLSIGLIVVAVAEMSGVYERSSGYWWSEGLGYRMFKSLDEARNDLLMASILAFAFLGITGDLLYRVAWRGVALLKLKIAQYRVMKAAENAREDERDFEFRWQDPVSISLANIDAGYGDVRVIDGLSLNIPPGSTVCVVGPSGCGKTTLMRSIGHFADLDFWVSAGVNIGVEPVLKPGPRIGLVMQESPVFEHMTVWDNICFGNRMQNEGGATAGRTAHYLLREFGISELAARKADSLSGGQRQRVSLAMAMANRPDLLLLDEPFGALDAITRRKLQRFYTKNVKGNVSAVFVTHDVDEALLVSDFVLVGVGRNSERIEPNKESLDPHEWELHSNFAASRARLFAALEKLDKAEA